MTATTEMAQAVSDARPGQENITYINEHGVPQDVMDELKNNRDIANAIELWSQELRLAAQASVPSLSLFSRTRTIGHKGVFSQMAQCAWAVENDDILSTLADVAESLTFQKVHFELFDPLQQDMWNQWAKLVNLDDFLRQAHRELFKVSQVYVGMWWDEEILTVRKNRIADVLEELELEAEERKVERLERTALPGEPIPPKPEKEGPGRGNYERPKKFALTLPTALTIFEPTKVVPVGTMMFGRERFAYVASDAEDRAFRSVFEGQIADGTVLQLVERRYVPSEGERGELQDLGIDPERLWLFKRNAVFRHTLTRANYERFAPVRLRSVLPVLEMKGHLRSSDRSSLVGNALRVDQRVATPGGWVPIGQIREGDLVMGRDGRPTEVRGVFPQGERSLFRVQFSDGVEVIADENHRWAVATQDDVRRGATRVLTTGQMLAQGVRVGRGGPRWSIPVAEPVRYQEADLPVDPYLLGVLLGDGGLTQATPRITWAEADQPWRRHLPADIAVTQYGSDANPSWGLRGTRWRENSLTAALRKLDLMGGRGETKFIPEQYLMGSVEQRRELMRGLFDTDGTPGQPGGVEYSTTSRQLAAQVVELVQSLGGVATLNTREATEHTREAYRVYASLPASEVPFKRARKAERWVPRKTRVVRAVAAIEPVAADEAVCIAVAAEDELFLTEGYVVTHNTNFIIVVTKGTDKLPARPAEIENLQEQVKVIARLPVLVGDHRLNVEIVSPALDNTLIESRWEVLDARLVFKALQTFQPTIQGGNASGGVKEMARIVGRGLESRRHMLVRSLERHIFAAVLKENEGQLDEFPSLEFTPRRISLDYSAELLNGVLKLRDRGDISRETTLEELDYDQDVEVLRRAREKVEFDAVFQSQTPHSSPVANPYGAQPDQPGANVGPNGQPRTEGGRPPGATDRQPRTARTT